MARALDRLAQCLLDREGAQASQDEIEAAIHSLKNDPEAVAGDWAQAALDLPLHRLPPLNLQLKNVLCGRGLEHGSCCGAVLAAALDHLAPRRANELAAAHVCYIADLLAWLVAPGVLAVLLDEAERQPEDWEATVRRLLRLPDRLACVLRGPAWWEPAPFAQRLAAEVVSLAAENNLSAVKEARAARFVSCMILGSSDGAAALALAAANSQAPRLTLWIAQLDLAAATKLLDALAVQAVSGRKGWLARVVGSFSALPPEMQRHVTGTWACGRVFSLATQRQLVEYWAGEGQLCNVVGAMLVTWSDRAFVRAAPQALLVALSQCLLLAVRALSDAEVHSNAGEWTRPFMAGASVYLESILPFVRLLGQIAAEQLAARLFDQNAGRLDFELDASDPLVRSLRSLEQDSVPGFAVAAPANSQIAEPLPNVLTTRESEAEKDSDDDSDFEPFNLAESEDEVAPVKRLRAPETLAETVAFLKAQPATASVQQRRMQRQRRGAQILEAPHDADRLELAVANAAKLVQKAPQYEAECHAADLCKRFVRLNDDYELENFDANVGATLAALAERCPMTVAPMLAQAFYEADSTHGQRLRALSALGDAARALANLSGYPATAAGATVAVSVVNPNAKTRVRRPVSLAQATGALAPPKTMANRFSAVAEYFFWPLANGWLRGNCVLRDRLCRDALNVHLVERLVMTLALLVYASGGLLVLPEMLRDFVAFLETLRRSASGAPALSRAVLFSCLVITQVFPGFLLSDRDYCGLLQAARALSLGIAPMVTEPETLALVAQTLAGFQRLADEAEARFLGAGAHVR